MRGSKLGRRRPAKISSRKGIFNPEDATRIKHTRIGVWDLYEEKTPELEHIPGSSKLEALLQLKDNLPYVWQMLLDIGSLKSCWTLLILYCMIIIVSSFIPAISLWYKGQLLTVVRSAVESRTVDKTLLAHMTLAALACKLAERFLQWLRGVIAHPLGNRVNKHYGMKLFAARARLDVMTFDDTAVQRQLDSASSVNGQGVAWGTISMFTGIVSTFLKIVTQVMVLAEVLNHQKDGLFLALLSMLPTLSEYFGVVSTGLYPGRRGVWAATTKNEWFIKMAGLVQFIGNGEHRKELVAGNMAEYTTAAYKRAVTEAGDYAAGFWESVRDQWGKRSLSPMHILRDCLSLLPQVTFALRAVQYPQEIPVSLASLTLVMDTSENFAWAIRDLLNQTGSIADQLETVRKLYQVGDIPNKVADGDHPYPEDQQQIKSGITLEFRHVCFKYPGATEFALQDVSFKVQQGQLCVIVGSNGSGKSTILKLAVRLYDITEGEILIDGHDIRTLKLKDLRQAVSVLFQDYTHFPLSIRDNIGLGDPSNVDDDEKIRLAARLGGAEEFIDRLPEGFDTYLQRPVQDHYSSLPEGTTTLFGRPVDYNNLRHMGGMGSTSSSSLSGGQMQRLAVSRTFMRSVVSDDSNVGLLLFDEPSASLDPTAEHDLFKRLRLLRGSKTMIFSSHRFGNLTRDADVILYMNDSKIVESGKHDDLLSKQGEYARIWGLQAQAFLP